MIFYYVRHGDPIYAPDSLTELGEKQAKALAKRFSLYGLDEIYASTSIRAQKTAQPTCEILKKEMQLLDWTNEEYAFGDFTVEQEDGSRAWVFHRRALIEKFNSNEVLTMGKEWYNHADLLPYGFEKGICRVDLETDAFFEQLGFKHDRTRGCYETLRPNLKRVALFAHQGFGLAFLSSVMDIPYPMFCSRFDIQHSGVTVIHFDETQKFVYPKILQHSNDSHLYKEGVLTGYHNKIDI